MQENTKQVIVKMTARRCFRTEPIWQYDGGHVLTFEGFDLPMSFEVHFSRSPMGNAIPQIGTNGVCTVPEMFTQNAGVIYAWLYIADVDSRLTKYSIEIPVTKRAKPTNQEPTPVEQSAIDQAIAALNAGVEAAEDAQEAAESAQASAESYAESAGQSAITATNAATAAATSAGNAAASATSAGTSATDANASRQAADLSATNAGVSERNAAASATAAAGSATSAAASASQASASATAASGSASTASTKASEAAQSATAAAGSAASASEDAGTASTAATAAEASATAAAGSATAAAGSATSAGQSATAAAGSAAAAQEVLESIPEDYSDLSDDVNSLKSAISAIQPITGTGRIVGWLSDYRYSIANGVATLAKSIGNSTIRIPAQKGDVFTLNMPSATGYSTWSTIMEVDDNNNVLWRSPYTSNDEYILDDYQYVVKNDDTTAVILNAKTSTMGASYFGVVNTKRIKNAESLLKEKYNFGIASHSDELILHQSFFNMDFTADWFLEMCFNNANIPTSASSNDYLISFHKASNANTAPFIRILRNNFQFMIGSQYVSNFVVANLADGINHVMYICKNHIVSTYVNGNLLATETMTDDTISKLNTFDGLRVRPLFNITLLRFGTSGDVAPEARYNNTSPYAYNPIPAENVIVDIRPEDFHADYFYDRAGNIYYNCTLTIDNVNPFPETIHGNGSPAITPRFIGQKYYDATASKWYTANGMSGVGNWVRYADTTELAGKQNTLQSGTTIKTINGTSILGAGNIQIGEGGGGSSGVVVNVVDYGATGDGATDDTNAIMQALEVVRVAGGTLFFPYNAGNCTYLTRKGLVLESNMGVDADRGAILKNASAVLPDAAGNPATGSCAVTTITANLAQGGHSCTVASTAGLAVGQEITIYTNNSAGYTDTHADITAISGSTITFDTSRFTSDGTDGGAVSAHASGSYLFTDFSLIETVKRPSEHITIKNITLQPCGNANEPYVYTISPIHETAQSGNAPQNDFRVTGVTIDGSAQDGISVQGSGDAWVEDCIVKNVKWKGIHFGTSCDKVIIRGNLLDNCGNTAPAEDRNYNWGGGGIYWCVNNHRVLVEGNQINNCRRGCFGFDYRGNGETDTDSIISGNTFKGCAYAGVRTEGGWRLNVNGNVFLNFTGTSVPIHSEGGTADSGKLQHAVIANNIIGAFENAYTNTLGAIRLDNALYPIVTGNNIQPNTNSTGSAQIVLTGTTGGVITSNVSGGVDVSDSGNVSCVAESNVIVA